MTKLCNCVEILDYKRIPISKKDRQSLKKIYPYYGAQGIIDYVDKYIFDGEYILVAEDGENLKSRNQSIATWAEGKFWVNNHAHILGKKENYNLKYIYYVLSLIDLSGLITGSAQPKLSQDNLSSLELNLPNIDIQNKVAEFLFNIDSKIQNNKKQIETLESLAKSIYDYWFVQFDFPNEEGKPYKASGGKMVWNEELKREIPEYWTVKNLSEVSDIVMGCSPKGDTINTAGDGLLFFQGASDFGNVYPIETAYTTAPIRIAKKGDLMISVRAPVGDINFTLTRCCIGRGLAAISTDKLSKSYLWCFLNNQKAHFSILNRIGTTFGCLSKNDLYKIKIVLPTKNVYNNFISITEPLEKSIRLAHLESTNLTKLKNFLLPLLMNGQVTFKEAKEI